MLVTTMIISQHGARDDRMVSVPASLTEIIVMHSTFKLGLPKLPG